MQRIWFKSLFTATALLLCAALASADTVVDLTSGGTATANGVIYSTTLLQPTGTGVIEPFLRLQATGTEQGYNADYSNTYGTNYDEKVGIWTHSVLFSSLRIIHLTKDRPCAMIASWFLTSF